MEGVDYAMTASFEKLEEEKQRQIRQAALAEFAEYGFQQASTNRIVKAAGIGKGMLFYYFSNKQQLYEYLAEYSLEFIQHRFLDRIDGEEPDLIERLLQLARVKMEAQAEDGHVFRFAARLMQAETQLPESLTLKMAEQQRFGYRLMYEGIDKSRFRKDADADRIFNLIRWSIDGFQQDLLSRLAGKKLSDIDFAPYWEEFYGYVAILKSSFYDKEESSSCQ